jgi:thiosulfate/3-mercaptopyruvate sulfurtransferase
VEGCLEAFELNRQRQHDSTAKSAEDSPRLFFVDGSWYHKGARNGRHEFEEGPRIVASRYIDMDDLACQKALFPDKNPKGLPHMLPTPSLMSAAMDAMHIGNTDHVVVYGKEGCIFTPRTWFLFYAMGHDKQRIHLMQGPLEEWIAKGGEIESRPVKELRAKDLFPLKPASGYHYQARETSNTCNMDFVLEALSDKDSTKILDPRGSSFKKGHIPGAIQIPYKNLVEPGNALKFKSRSELEKVMHAAGLDLTTKDTIICSCGSGVSVCHLLVALRECGRSLEPSGDEGKTVMYDGSWSEWGSDRNTPKIMYT